MTRTTAAVVLQLHDILDGHTDVPTDPAALAPLIDAASAMQCVLLHDRLVLEFHLDPGEADRRWSEACDLVVANRKEGQR